MLRFILLGFAILPAFAAAPEAKTALWLTSEGAAAHDTYAHRSITLKGSSSEFGPHIRATWDFGDGSAPATFAVEKAYDVSAKHSYFGAAGQEFEARLTVRNMETGESGTAVYRVAMREQTPEVEINIAIDEGLWRLHVAMHESEISESDRFAFETQGHSAEGPKSDPYTDTLAALKQARANRAVRQSTLSTAEQHAIAMSQNADGSWTSTGQAGESAMALMSMAKTPVSRELGINSILNVSGSVTATTSSISFNRLTGTYNVTLTITNISVNPITGPINAGITALPGGITLANATGTFNGAPYIFVTASSIPAGGQAAVQLRFSNPAAAPISFGRVTYSGTFPPAALTIACPANTATVGTPYSSSIDANGGARLYSFSISPGSLPSSLTLDAQTGAITGTPDAAGPSDFTAVVTDSAGATPQTVNAACTITVGNGGQPDLTITKTHSGSFTQGSAGNPYTVTVTNSGTGDKSAGQAVSVTDAPPSGLTVTAMSGTGWTCTTLPTCTRNDVLAAGNSYPAITVTVSVTPAATSPQVNSITVTTAQTESNAGNNTATDSTVIVQPDLTIAKTHSGDFVQGSTGNDYTVTVTNSGQGTKSAGQAVSVTDAPPTGLSVTAMSGTGWTCTTLPTCTRNDVLAAGNSYPAITVTVSVTPAATSPQVNSITVTTAQNESNAGNNTATDSTVITPAPQPDLTIAKTHAGSFTQGSTGNPYTVTVTNSGTGDKSAGQAVSVTDAPPSGLSVTVMSGTGWTCTTLPTCTRNDVLAAGNSYPAITVTVSVTPTATSPQVNSITVTTAQTESNAANNTATDSTVIVQPDLTITKTHTGDFTQGSAGNNYTVTVTNSGLGSKNAGQAVSVTDAPPAGLTVTAMSGAGWTCTTLPTCTRNDVLAPSGSYPAITVTVTVAANATSPQVNSITVTTAQNESNGANNTATDSTNIIAPPAITSANTVTFAPGLAGQTFTVMTTGQPSGVSMVISETGALPTGVTFTNNNNGTATIGGTPAAGTQGVSGNPRSQAYPLTIGADNGIPPPASQAFTLNITCPVVNVSGAATLSAVFGIAMTTSTFTQTGGNGTISWSATGLPTNLTIGSGNGTVSGTPNVTGNFNAVITATDAGGCTGTKAVTVTVVPNLPAQSYTGVGNTQFFITGAAGAPTTPAVSSANGLLTGVTPVGGVTITGASCAGGTIAFDAAGRFIFTPNVSATSASCNYTGSSNTGPGSTGAASATASLTFTLNNKVWYVSHGSAGAHDGRSNNPFLDMGGGANNLDCTGGTATGDYVYVAQGTGNTTGACALKTNQKLIGAGTTLTVGPLTVTGSVASTPTVTGTLSASSASGLTVNGVSLNTGASSAVNFVSSGGTFTFRRIDTSGAATPITLSSTTGTFTVSGDGTGFANGSGGTLANSTTAALTATTAAGTVSLNSMNISITVLAPRGVLFDNLAGGTLTGNITGCTFAGVGPGNSSQQKALLHFDVGGSANVTPNVQNSFFFNNRSYGFAVVAAGSATVNATLNQSGFGTNVNSGSPVNKPGTTIITAPPFSLLVSNSGLANVRYNITNNTFWGARSADGALYAVTIGGAAVSAGGALNGFFTGNRIGVSGLAGSGCSGNCAGLGLLPGTGGTFNATVNNNDIRRVGSFGINFANTTSGSTVNMIGHITNNTLAEPDTVSPGVGNRAIVVSPGNSGGAAVNSCAAITGNTATGSWQPGFFVRITTNNTTGTMVLPGLSPGTGATAAQINAFVQANNPGVPAVSVGTTVGGPINGGAACAVTP